MAEVLPHRYELLPVGQLSPHPENPNEGDVEAIMESIDALGFYGAVMVHGPTGHIIAGEHRWKAAKADGLAELPCLIYDVDEATARKMMTGDNAFARLGRWNVAKLSALLQGFGHDLRGSGFTESDVLIAEAGAADLAALADREYRPGHLGPTLVIHCGLELIERFRALPGADDAARLEALLDQAEKLEVGHG